MTRPPVPPFRFETATDKVRLAEDGWNSRDPEKVVLACPSGTRWRNRVEFPIGRDEVRVYGNENREFDADGLMADRHASINETPISEADRKFRWPLGTRPLDHPELSELGV